MTTVDHIPPHDQEATVDDGATVTRSEEQVAVSLPVRVRGGLRIHKIVVTETVTQTVQVRREHLLAEELSVDDLALGTTLDTTDRETAGYELADQEFEIILHEERVVLDTQIVPVERVRVRTRIVTDQVDVSDTVRREQIDTEIENWQ